MTKSTKARATAKAKKSATAGGAMNVMNHWTDREKQKFHRGVVLHGWGSWRLIESVICTRTNTQIKSHAQKVNR